MSLYEDQFSDKHDYPTINKTSKILIIASTGRSGSHMLGHALHQTGSFGFPLEYVNPVNLSEWKRRLEENDLHKVLAEIQRRRTSANGVFGIKIHYSHIQQFGGFSKLQSVFPNAHYVLLSRENVLKQAVSLSIAMQTGVWIAGQQSKTDNPLYDFEQINKYLRQIILHNASWRYTLAGSGSNYIEMDFDHVRNHLRQSIQDIAKFIDIEIDPDSIPQQQVTKLQSSDLNEEWAQRFTQQFDQSEELINDKQDSLIKSLKAKVKKIINA